MGMYSIAQLGVLFILSFKKAIFFSFFTPRFFLEIAQKNSAITDRLNTEGGRVVVQEIMMGGGRDGRGGGGFKSEI